MQQVISVSPTGEISGLQHKPGQGVDLIKLAQSVGGKASVVRASEIIWNDTTQKWIVEFREGAGRYTGRVLDAFLVEECMRLGMVGRAGNEWIGSALLGPKPTLTYQFDTYEDAIKAEIAVLNCLRLAGKIAH